MAGPLQSQEAYLANIAASFIQIFLILAILKVSVFGNVTFFDNTDKARSGTKDNLLELQVVQMYW